MSTSKFVETLRRRVIKDFLDILILTELKKGHLSGYDIIRYVHRKFDVLISSGTVYSLLYSLEREGFIKGIWEQRKKIYEIAGKGEQNIKLIMKADEEIQNFLTNISLLNATM